MNSHRRQWLLAALGILCLPAIVRAESYYLIDNFSSPLPGNAMISIEPDRTAPKVGLASGKLSYHLNPGSRSGSLNLPDNRLIVPAAGTLKLWIKGDGSGNELQLTLRHAAVKADGEGRRSLEQQQELRVPPVKLDFDQWKEVSLDARAIPAGRAIWLDGIQISAGAGGKLDGAIFLDDLRVVPAANPPTATFTAELIGKTVRPFSADIAMSVDVRTFGATGGKVRARMTVMDRNENLVVDRDLPLELGPGEGKEIEFSAKADNLDAFLPPFKVSLDVLSTDFSEVAGKVERTVVMGNSTCLFDDFSNVTGRWFTAGLPDRFPMHTHNWQEWAHAEGQRFTAVTQTSARIERVEVGDSAQEQVGDSMPRGKYGMKLAWNGHGLAWSGVDRYLPGNAYRMGVWVKGDGSGALLSALVLDYTDGVEFWPGGWRRITADMPLCRLDFTDWRYFTVELPGNGIGKNTSRGSTYDLDYPLELTAFHVTPGPSGSQSGEVLIGSVYVETQLPASGALSVQVGYDDPSLCYQPAANATATIQNSWYTGTRKVKATWAVLDRNDAIAASGNVDLEIAAKEAKTFTIPLAQSAAALAARDGPFKLQVVASDARDVSVSTSREIMISRPDSLVPFADFELVRGYVGLQAAGVFNAQPLAMTSTAQAHSGKQSLAIEWDKSKLPQRLVSIDPSLPGVPTEVSMWVYGDNSGALFYPLIGDRRGIVKGAPQGQWNMFLGRSTEGPLANAVKIDFSGWKKLTFKLPVPQSNYKSDIGASPFTPNYPLGLHLCVLGADAGVASGTVYVDDVQVTTQLPANQRMGLVVERAGESNVLRPGDPVKIRVANYDLKGAVKAELTGGMTDWRGVVVGGLKRTVELAPGTQEELALVEHAPAGAYKLRVALKRGDIETAATNDDVIIGDVSPFLGSEVAGALKDPWKLRGALHDRFAFVDEDWDWVEHFPGNLQLDTIRTRTQPVKAAGGEPYVLLGYSAYWAAGVGHEQMKVGAFSRRQRDIGHAVDIFLVPDDLDDWDAYVREVMRGVGKDVGGFVVWNNPDTEGPMGVKPEKFAQMLASAGKYRRAYCPKTPLLIGGMNRTTAVGYLKELGKLGAFEDITGVNVRLDVGRISPEDAEVPAYLEELDAVLNPPGAKEKRSILLTDLDWAVEKDAAGLNSFDQAAYLVRSEFLLARYGISPELTVRNEDDSRGGLGLTWRNVLSVPPTTEQLPTLQLRPAWWALARTRTLLGGLEHPQEVVIADAIPDRTRCLAFTRKGDGKPVVVIWRNDDAGRASLGAMKVEAAEDLVGAPVAPAKDGTYAVGKMPVMFTLASAEGLERIQVFDADGGNWSQRMLAAFPATGGAVRKFSGRAIDGMLRVREGRVFAKGESEKFAVDVPVEGDLVLRKQFFLDETGQSADVFVNGTATGTWDLMRSDPQLASGFRDAIFIMPRAILGKASKAEIELKYTTAGNTLGWQVMQCLPSDKGVFDLAAVGAIHADQNVGHLRYARNVIGSPLKIGATAYANGLGTFARSLVEVPLNGQYSRFTAKVGVDAATEGRGSVTFEVYADGKKIWESPVMSGLDAPRDVDVEVKGAKRLRLVVGDAGDGNKSDAADWIEAVLRR